MTKGQTQTGTTPLTCDSVQECFGQRVVITTTVNVDHQSACIRRNTSRNHSSKSYCLQNGNYHMSNNVDS